MDPGAQIRAFMGSAQIDVKISFKGRQPNKESAQSRSAATFPRPRPLHTKRNVITLLVRKKNASLFMRSYAGSTGWVISTIAGWFNFDP